MTLNVAIQMDPIGDINIDADSTFVMALEARARGYRLFYYHVDGLSLIAGTVTARAQSLDVRREAGNHFSLGDVETINLADMDVVLMRQDPPFDMGYISATHMLEQVHPDTLVVNDPAHVRNAPEKIFATLFPGLMPPTLISRDPHAIRAFRDEHTDIILKPLYGNGGAGVFHVPPGDDNFNALLEMFAAQNSEPLMAQAYLADVRGGDKRIILFEGKPVGAINRIPPVGDVRANMHAGGTPKASKLTKREHDICDAIGPELQRRGLIFAGIDVIGDWLTEINVTSPTGLQEINRFDGVKLESDLWNCIEARLR